MIYKLKIQVDPKFQILKHIAKLKFFIAINI
jgi:hypothetical protein